MLIKIKLLKVIKTDCLSKIISRFWFLNKMYYNKLGKTLSKKVILMIFMCWHAFSKMRKATNQTVMGGKKIFFMGCFHH
jgi:hypothetical protein